MNLKNRKKYFGKDIFVMVVVPMDKPKNMYKRKKNTSTKTSTYVTVAVPMYEPKKYVRKKNILANTSNGCSDKEIEFTQYLLPALH
jgi:hypothetical protein